MSNYSAIKYNDCTNGNGVCVSVWFSGCEKHCPGCHNPDEQNPNFGEPFTQEVIDKIIGKLNANGILRSLSILGGEPLTSYNAAVVEDLIRQVRAAYPEIKIFLWTGYTFEELDKFMQEPSPLDYILNNVSYLIVGPYIEAERDITLPLRGSRNQEIYKTVKTEGLLWGGFDITQDVDNHTYKF